MANAYHMDALRKQRVIDRKNEALRRMMDAGSEGPVPDDIVQRALHQSTTDGLVTTDMGQYNQVRETTLWTGRERNKRDYDHSRDGPVIRQSWANLRSEYGLRKHTAPTLGGASFIDLVMNR